MVVKGLSKWSIVKMLGLLSLYSILFLMVFNLLAFPISIVSKLLILMVLGGVFYLLAYYGLKLVYWDLYKVKLTVDTGFSVKKVVLGLFGMVGAFFIAYFLYRLKIGNPILALSLYFGVSMFVFIEGLCDIITRGKRLVVGVPTSYYIKQGVISIGSMIISFIVSMVSMVIVGVITMLLPLSPDGAGSVIAGATIVAFLVSFSYAQLLMIYNYAKNRPISDVDIDITNSKFEEELLKNKLKGEDELLNNNSKIEEELLNNKLQDDE